MAGHGGQKGIAAMADLGISVVNELDGLDLCIVEDGGFKVSGSVLVVNIVQIPSSAEQISLCSSTFGNRT